MAVDRELFRGRALRIADASAQSRVHRNGLIDDRNWNLSERGGFQCCEQRASQAAELSKGGRIGIAAPDRSGCGRIGGFREWSVALALDVLHLCTTKPN